MAGGFGLYVHWPFCLSKCPYCDFNSHVRDGIDHDRWARALCTELRTCTERLAERPVLGSVFFGGGTPSLMAPETVAAVLETARELYSFAEDVEITLEANPTSVERAKFAAFRAAGINRVSLGVQSLNDEDLEFLGRKHSAREAIEAAETARSVFDRVSFDLIYARPGQTAGAWRAELDQALALGMDHLSLYQLTIEEGTKFHQLTKAGHLHPLEDDPAADLFELTQDLLEAGGLPAYETSNHARPGAESRHNLVYWRGGAWLGIGPGAHGRPPAGEGRIASETHRAPEAWLEAVEADGHGLVKWEGVAREDQATEYLLMGLRLREGLDMARLEALAPGLVDRAALDRLLSDGFLLISGTRLAATAKGRPVLNRLLRDLVAD